jgi:hypothetical protein
MVNHIAKRMTNMFWKNQRFVLAMVFLLPLLLGCVRSDAQDAVMSKEKIDSLIKSELPLGVSRESVVAYLDKHKVEHSGHLPASTSQEDIIYAIYRNAEGGGLFVKKSIQLRFHFKSNKLYACDADEVFTGP